MTFLNWYNNRRTLPERIIETYGVNMHGKTGSGSANIEIAKHYNGSGPTAFGGAKEWTNISVDIGFPVETSEADVQSLLHDMRMLLNKHKYS